jgi:hypothetical protein
MPDTSRFDVEFPTLRDEKADYLEEGDIRAWHGLGDNAFLVEKIVGHLKIGLTRKNRLPTRLREQGAQMACVLYTTSTRKEAGILEAQLTAWYSDRTDWRKMLLSIKPDAESFHQSYLEVAQKMSDECDRIAEPYEALFMDYPIRGPITPISLAKANQTLSLDSELLGIKGHYLIFDQGVLSLRSLMGRHIDITLTTP